MRPVLALGLLLFVLPARAGVIEVTPADDLRELLAGAEPGDEYVLSAGTYDLGAARTVISVLAGPSEPVVLRSAAGVRAVLFRPTTARAVLDIESSSNIVLRGLELVGGARGIDIISSDQVVIEESIIHGAAGAGVAATTGSGTVAQNTYEGLTIRDNDIYANGAGVVLGCDGAFICSAPNVRVERNDIYASATEGGIRLGPGSVGAVIRDNWVHDGVGFGIALAGDAQGAVIERNAMWRLTGFGVEVTRGASVRNNIVIAAADFALRAVVDGAAVSDLRLVNNTIVGNSGLAIAQAQSDVVVANNAIYADTAFQVTGSVTGVTFSGNVGSGAQVGVAGLLASGGTVAEAFVRVSADGGSLNAHLRSTSVLVGAGDASLQPADDFDRRPRGTSRDVGAYVFVEGDDDEPGGGSGLGGSQAPGVGGSPFKPGPARSEEGCAALPAAWPVLLGMALYLRRRC